VLYNAMMAGYPPSPHRDDRPPSDAEETSVELESTQKATDAVEWLAALWELTGQPPSRSANPHILTLLQWTPRLSRHVGFDAVATARRTESRDRVIKSVVNAAYGDTTWPLSPCVAPLEQFLADVQDLLGPGPYAVIQQTRTEAQRRVEALAGDLDPARDLAQLTGEHVPLRVVLAPSVFLPPPQAGRHGVLVQRPDVSVAHLHFGFPLRYDPHQFSVNRSWLLGGAWHYAIQLYLDRHWPPIARRLAAREDLGAAVRAVMAAVPGRSKMPRREAGEQRPWTDILATHLNLAMKCVLSHQLGLPDGVHRTLAKVQGFALFPWVEAWLWDGVGQKADFAAFLSTLPEALDAGRAQWERLAAVAAVAPVTVNFTLASLSARSATLVVPDEWTDEAAAAAVAGWGVLTLPLKRYGDWIRTRSGDSSPVIAFGEPDRNVLVRRVLDQRRLSMAALNSRDAAIVALSMPGFAEADWCIAVAVTRPETAAALRVEMVLNRTNPYIVFDRGVVIDAGEIDRSARHQRAVQGQA
jgi:hypothetical protein